MATDNPPWPKGKPHPKPPPAPPLAHHPPMEPQGMGQTVTSMAHRGEMAFDVFLALCASSVHDVGDGQKAARIAFQLTDAFLAELEA